MVEVEFSSADLLAVRFWSNGEGCTFIDPQTWSSMSKFVEVVFPDPNTNPTHFTVGIRPRKHQKPRIDGNSDTLHPNFKGKIKFGPSPEFDTQEFSGMRYKLDPQRVQRMNDAIAIMAGECVSLQWPSYFGNGHCMAKGGIYKDYEHFVVWLIRNRQSNWTQLYVHAVAISYDYTSYFYVQQPYRGSSADPSTVDLPDDIRNIIRDAPTSSWSPIYDPVHPSGTFGSVIPVTSAGPPHLRMSKSYWTKILKTVADRLEDCVQIDEPKLQRLLGELGQKACDNFRPVQANTFSTIREILGLKGEVKDWLQGLGDVLHNLRHPGKFIKALGNLRLSSKWGIPLTVGDARDILDTLTDDAVYGVCRDRWQKSNARGSLRTFGRGLLYGQHPEMEVNVTAFVSKYDNRFTHMTSWLADYNVISLANVWDMIPYSFVVDWFTGIDQRIELLDSTAYRDAYLDVRGAMISYRYEVNVSAQVLEKLLDIPVQSADLTYCHYHREISSKLPWPTLEDKAISSNLGLVQYLDGGTLILQRV